MTVCQLKYSWIISDSQLEDRGMYGFYFHRAIITFKYTADFVYMDGLTGLDKRCGARE